MLVIGDARVELAVPNVERYDFGRSPAQQYVGEATGGGTDIQTFQAFRPGKAIAGKGFERAQEFVSASGDVVVAFIHGEFAVPGFDHERWLGDGLAVHAHMPGLDESLRFGPRFDQSRSHEHHVKSVKWSRGIDMLLGHISSFRPTIHQRGGSAWSHHPALHVIFRWRENESPLLAAAVIKLVL